MAKGRKKRNYKSTRKTKWIIAITLGIVCIIVGIVIIGKFLKKEEVQEKPEDLLNVYMDHIPAKEYEQMYQMIDWENSGNIAQEDFITRNSNIYEGIEMQNMRIEILEVEEEDNETVTVYYLTTFDTVAGEVQFENEADFLKGETGYALIWNDSLIDRKSVV